MGKKRVIIKSVEPAELKVDQPLKVKTSKRRISSGQIHIQATYNNTIITVTDDGGRTLCWNSAGSIGFSGTKKATPFAASKVAEAIGVKAKKLGIQELSIFVKGIGSGRESAIRSLANQGFTITMIKDVTPIPHNGPRPPKVRRV
jgi:small subunit ribosomal protein S11